MRFKTSIRSINTFIKLTASLSSVHRLTWLRLSPDTLRFVIHTPSSSTQVWATIPVDTLFHDYRISSAAGNIINLEVPLAPLHRALRSCAAAVDAVLRLTKRQSDGIPVLCLTITTGSAGGGVGLTLITQEVPVRVLSAAMVDGIEEPQAPDPDVHIWLPSLAQLRGIAERFIKLGAIAGGAPEASRIMLGANLEGGFRMRLEGASETVAVESVWRGLQNPVLEGEVAASPRDPGAWAEVRMDGREWVKVLKVGQLAKRVVAAVCEDRALVLYVFLNEEGEEDTILTYYMSSFSA
ncbi:checkpoint protein Hus1/Mec3 [Geopyxis carbonaria]|nr:checkpoint protein Hus1/Mec3 [Geopyxis carbonaria]